MTDVSYVSGPSERPLIARTIGQELDHSAALHGGLEALVSRYQGVRLTYAELREQAERLARALIALGVQAGDRIGIWSPNNAEWVITQYGAAKAGAILVNVNPAYKTQELDYILDRAGVSLLVSARAFRSTDYVAMLGEDELRSMKPTARIINTARGGIVDEAALIDTIMDALATRSAAHKMMADRWRAAGAISSRPGIASSRCTARRRCSPGA